MDDDKLADIRTWCLDRAIQEIQTGTAWEYVFALASKYERYIIHGTWSTPVADAQKEYEATHVKSDDE